MRTWWKHPRWVSPFDSRFPCACCACPAARWRPSACQFEPRRGVLAWSGSSARLPCSVGGPLCCSWPPGLPASTRTTEGHSSVGPGRRQQPQRLR
jgi:hypothetical protein